MFQICLKLYDFQRQNGKLLFIQSHGWRSLVGCSPWGREESLFTFMHWRRQWQPTPVFLPGKPQGQRSLVGCRLQGRTESDATEATAASAADHTVPGILQARILERVAFPFSRGSSQHRDQTQVSHIAAGFFTS